MNWNRVKIFAITAFCCVSCEDIAVSDNNEGSGPSEENTLVVQLCSDWGMSKAQVKSAMVGYTLKREEENSLYFYKDNWSQLVSYEFYEGGLCTSLLMIKKEVIKESDFLDFVTGYQNVGMLDGEALYCSEDKNAVATYSQNRVSASTYLTLGITQLDLEYISEYIVGDYYNDNGKKGVVFYVDSTCKHGKIVSLDETSTKLKWANGEIWENTTLGINANNEEDGKIVMNIVKGIANWEKNYPAFAWCANIGNDWYLPAINELKLLMLNESVHSAVNRTLAIKGTPLPDIGSKPRKCYWSATEYDYYRAWLLDMLDKEAVVISKNLPQSVRAISSF